MLDGKYKIEARTPLGALHQTLVFTNENNVLGGYIDDGKEQIPFGSIKMIDDTHFEGDAELPTPIGKFKSTVQGVIEGDTISGRVKTPFGMAKFKGEKI